MDIFSRSQLILLSFGLFLTQLIHGALGITVTNTLSNSRPRLGETIKFTCNIAGGTADGVTWYKDKRRPSDYVYVSYNCKVVAKKYKPRLSNVRCDSNNYDFELKNVQISDRGDWECEAYGQESTSKLRLDVLVPPLNPTVTNPSPVKVGDRAQFTCNAENDDVTKPVTYTWTKNSNTVSSASSQPGVLLFQSITKSDAGKYVCIARNDAGSRASVEQELVVYYAPNTLTLKTTTSSNSKAESETETFTCKADGGNPVPTIKLIRQEGSTKETLIQQTKRIVTFPRQMMRRDNQVKFYCEARGPGIPNYMASGVITYNVLFPHSVKVKTTKTTVSEHEFVRFECQTGGGNPEHIDRYQWLWQPSDSTTEKVIQDTETSTHNGKFLDFERIPYDKSGTYTCKAWNKGGMGMASIVLNVQYSPRIDPQAKMQYDVAGELGKEASFALYIIANPTPVSTGYVWSKEGAVISMSSSDYVITSGPTSSILKIKKVKSTDYKNYTCSVKTSGFQAKVFEFKLLKAGPPSTPRKLKVLNATAVAATLEWISAFPGGSEQKFYVQYKKSAETWNKASEVPQGGIADPGFNKPVYYKVRNLEPNVWYVFRVYSKNAHPGPHTSNFSNIASEKTPEAPQTSVDGVTRDKNKVTIRWKPVTGKYTTIKIKYCQTATENCANYTVSNPENNYAEFFVDNGKTYYYYMLVEDVGDVVYKSNPLVVEKGNSGEVKTANIGMIAGMIGAGVVLIIVVIIIIAVIMRRKKPNKKKREAQELQNLALISPSRPPCCGHHWYCSRTTQYRCPCNARNDQLVPLDGQVNHAMYRTPTRSECDISEHRHQSLPSLSGSQHILTPLHVNLQKPDVVSHTQNPENPYQNVPVGQNGSRPPSLASRSSRPSSRAEENPYQNVNIRGTQPPRYSGGVPQRVGVDGTVYAELSFHGPQNQPHPQYNTPIRRTEDFSPYASVDFSRKAPPMNIEYTV